MSIKCPICCSEFDDNLEVCPACGFKFSGTTQSFSPIDAKESSENADIDKGIDDVKAFVKNGESPELRVVSGPQGEMVLPLSKEKMTIGRSPNCDIFLNHRTVSRDHAIIAINENGAYQIADMNSFNGIWINNKSVTISELHDGDLIQIGIFVLRFEER